MKNIEIKYKHGKSVVSVKRYACENDEAVMEEIGSAGCAHDGDFTYFFQCPVCKTISTSYSGYRDKDLEDYGWKKVTN